MLPKTIAVGEKLEYFMVVDTETGGLNKDEHELLEIGAVVYDYLGNCVDSYEIVIESPTLQGRPYVSPKKKINLIALKINKIHQRSTKKSKPEEVAVSFANWCLNVAEKYNPTLVGQNLQFDIGFINPFMELHGFSGWSELFHYHRIDTVPIALALQRVGVIKSEKVSLVNLAKELRVEHTSAHSALSDAHATAGVYLGMLKQLKMLVGTFNAEVPKHPDV